MSGAINLTIEKQEDGFKANRWTKNGERGLADRIYVDAPNGIKVGYYDLVKGGWVMDKNNRTHMMELLMIQLTQRLFSISQAVDS